MGTKEQLILRLATVRAVRWRSGVPSPRWRALFALC